jgi:hypothetical protein
VKRHIVVAVAGICAMLTGCGGSSSSMSKETVQQQGREWIKDQTKEKTPVDQPECVEDGSAGRWRCITDVHGTAGATVHITFTGTCDAERCVFKLVSAS